MNNILSRFNESQRLKILGDKSIPVLRSGDTVTVAYKALDSSSIKRRSSIMGVIIAIYKSAGNYGYSISILSSSGVEKLFKIYSPCIESISVMRHGIVRRKKPFYLRKLTGKAARLKERYDHKKV